MASGLHVILIIAVWLIDFIDEFLLNHLRQIETNKIVIGERRRGAENRNKYNIKMLTVLIVFSFSLSTSNGLHQKNAIKHGKHG